MQVSISKAAEMVGVTRATFYRHVEKKGISLIKDDDGNPKVDVSELIRVYKDRVRVNSSQDELNTFDTPQTIHPKQSNTPHTIQVEIEVLRERLTNLETEKSLLEKERGRERDQLQEQIDTLKDHLQNSQEQQKRLTLMLTDQRKPEPGREQGDEDLKFRLEQLMKHIETQGSEKEEQEKRIMALESRISEIKEKGDSVLKNLSEKNKKLGEENKQLKEEVSRSWWDRLFG